MTRPGRRGATPDRPRRSHRPRSRRQARPMPRTVRVCPPPYNNTNVSSPSVIFPRNLNGTDGGCRDEGRAKYAGSDARREASSLIAASRRATLRVEIGATCGRSPSLSTGWTSCDTGFAGWPAGPVEVRERQRRQSGNGEHDQKAAEPADGRRAASVHGLGLMTSVVGSSTRSGRTSPGKVARTDALSSSECASSSPC